MFDLKGKVVIITGGGKGIGAAAVRNFLEEGAKFVAFIDVDETSGNSLEEELQTLYGKDALKFFKCDVTKDAELFNVFDYTVKNRGYIDLVVNNAAIGDDTIPKKEIEINFTAVVTSTLKALEIMRKDNGGKGGTVINISSLAGIVLQKDPGLYVYCATKSAIVFFSANIGVETYYSHTGVRIITVCFGLTSTGLVPQLRGIDDLSTISNEKAIKIHAQQKQQSPKEAASGIVEAFKKGKSGSTWVVNQSEATDISDRVYKAYQVMSGEIDI